MPKHLFILKQKSVRALREQISNNLALYESENPEWANVLGTDYLIETSVEINGSIDACFASENFRTMKKEDVQKDEADASRCVAIYNALKNLTPQEAADERVWTYLTHFVFWDYARARWPLPKNQDKKIQSIKSHFFLEGVRGMAHDNAISRLWWTAHVCNRVKNCTLEKALKALLHKEDVRKEVMTRPTFCSSEPILNALMKYLVQSYESTAKKLHDRETFRQLGKQLNRDGGKIILDSLAQKQLDEHVGFRIKNIKTRKQPSGKAG